MKLNTHFTRRRDSALRAVTQLRHSYLPAHEPKPIEERGIIKSVDMSAHTLVVTEHKENTDQKFQWNDQTKFSERNKSASPSDLKAGRARAI